MITPDINRFVSTLLYPVTDSALVYQDDMAAFFARIPESFVDTETGDELFQIKKKIRASLLRYLMQQYSVDSYDQIYQYLDRWYLSGVNWRELRADEVKNRGDLFSVVFRRLRQLSKSMVSKLDGQIIYKYWETEGDAELLGGFVGAQKIHLFRSMMQKIPMDLLVACFAVDKEYAQEILAAYRGTLAITDAPLEKILSKGVSENHIHTGVSTNFSIMWEELMSTDQVMSDPLCTWLPRVSRPNGPSQTLVAFEYLLARCLRMYLICAMEYSEQKMEDIPLHLLQQKCLLNWFKRVQNESVKLAEVKAYFNPLETSLAEAICHSETLKQEWTPTSERPFTEIFFLHRLLTRCRQMEQEQAQGHPKSMEAAVIQQSFLNYLRLKHTIFQWNVQEKTVSGLDYFQTFYRAVSTNKSGPARQIERRNLELNYQRLIDTQLRTPHIRCVEFRISFFRSEPEAIANVRAFLRAYRTILQRSCCVYDPQSRRYRPVKKLPRVGIVFSFLKSEQSQPDLCGFLDEELAAYKRLHDRYQGELAVFRKIRDVRLYPGIDRYLVGIDVASLENAVPTWVFSDLYDCARDSDSEVFRGNLNRQFQSLRFTCHVGEDFRHLMSGLRRIHEVVHHLKFHTGDRIGHGLALGLDVERWCGQHPNVILPRIEALENYVWAYRMLSEYPSRSKGSDLLYLEKRISRLAAEIYCPGDDDLSSELYISTDTLVKSYCRLFSKKLYDQVLCCRSQCEDQPDCILRKKDRSIGVEFIVRSYHCHRYAVRMNEPIHYQIQPQEVSILKDLQEIMQLLISRAGIVVETNPTSNLVISSIDTIREHPIYPLSEKGCDYKDIMLCINSDDPGVFQTNTSNELGIAYMGMIEQGKGRNHCLDWIDKMRESGMRHSFIYQDDEDEALLRELDELLEALE